MHRVDTATAVAALPAPQPAGTPGYFSQGDPVGGVSATVPGPDFMNAMQEELAGIVLAAGLALDKNDRGQVLKALRLLLFGTGDVKLTLKNVADPGWVLMNDGSIGNAASGATTRANADTEALFTLLWGNVANTWCPVQDSTGAPVARGATAAADFAANRRIVLPKVLGRALAAAGAGAGLTARALGETLGTETHQLTQAETPLKSHGHGVNDPGHPHGIGNNGTNGTDLTLQNSTSTRSTFNTDAAVTGITIQNTGDATAIAHPNMQPSSFLNVMIKL